MWVFSQGKTVLGQAGMEWRVKVATLPGLLEELIRSQFCVPASSVDAQQGGH